VRRTIALALLLALPTAALAIATACDDTGTRLASADAAADSTRVDAAGPSDDGSDASADAVEELVMADVCGPGPWITFGIVVVALDLSNPDGSVLAGAEFTSPLCPGVEKLSDEAGLIEGQISVDRPFYGRLQAKGYVSELTPEEIVDANTTGNKLELLPSILTGLVPGFQPDASTVVIAAQATEGDAGACSSLDGIAFAVSGQPGVSVIYFSNGSIPLPVADASTTTTRGFAAITGLNGGGFITLAGTKPGCNVVFARGPLTGRVPIENGFVSLMPAYLTP